MRHEFVPGELAYDRFIGRDVVEGTMMFAFASPEEAIEANDGDNPVGIFTFGIIVATRVAFIQPSRKAYVACYVVDSPTGRLGWVHAEDIEWLL